MSHLADRSRIAVIGASTAGLAAAETLRKSGYTGGLTIVGAELHRPYKRPPLSKQVLTGVWTEERAFLRTPAELGALDASWHLGASAMAIDRNRGQVTLSDSTTVDYDGLVIATGVSPRTLPTGHELIGVHVVRTLGDAHALRAEMQRGRRLVIVGAGFLGCEVAAAAEKAGLHVTLVDPLSGPMTRQLGPTMADHVAELHRSHGADLRLGVGVAALSGVAGRVGEVNLTNGETLKADVVLVAVGSVPNTDWLVDSGMSLSNGVETDQFCRVDADIVAAGDVASWYHVGFGRRLRLEHQTNALEQGTAAARALLSEDVEPFAPVPFFWSDQYDVKIQVYGVPHADSVVSVVRGDPASGRFAIAYRHEGRLVGVLTWNLPREAIGLRAELEKELATNSVARR